MTISKPSDPEEAYFKRQELELRKQIRAELAKSADELHQQTQKPELLQRIRALGFSGDNAQVFDLLPLVQVAWADGSVSQKERALIFRILEQRKILPESAPFRLIESLLESRPTEAFLTESLALLRDTIGSQHATNIVDCCIAVASISGGLFGLGLVNKVNNEERELIEKISQTFGSAALDRFYRQLG